MIEFRKVSALISLRSHITIILLLMPLYAVLIYAGYLIIIDNKSPLTINYQSAKFGNCEANTRAEAEACASTNAVVATCVVFVSTAAVGAAGVPVNVGDARGAREVSVGCT